uniref:Uncharacterized protein n=1 Tax=Strongyloides venezuelensis TaxID=75913 RepID=A0A0K0FPE7_STRVS
MKTISCLIKILLKNDIKNRLELLAKSDNGMNNALKYIKICNNDSEMFHKEEFHVKTINNFFFNIFCEYIDFDNSYERNCYIKFMKCMSQIIGTNILFNSQRLSARIRQKRKRNKIKVSDKKLIFWTLKINELISQSNYEEQLLGHEGYQEYKLFNFLRTTIPLIHRFFFPTEYTATSLPKQLFSFCKLMKIEKIFCSIENARQPLN